MYTKNQRNTNIYMNFYTVAVSVSSVDDVCVFQARGAEYERIYSNELLHRTVSIRAAYVLAKSQFILR